MKKIKLSEVKITSAFANTIPNQRKVERVRKNFLERNTQDKPLVIDENGYLLDGYIRYLVLKELGIENAEYILDRKRQKKLREREVNSYKNIPTYYVYGIHKPGGREFVWRVPKTKENIIDTILPGDKVFVTTKYGTKSVTVTNIQISDVPPIDGRIRKVIKAL